MIIDYYCLFSEEFLYFTILDSCSSIHLAEKFTFLVTTPVTIFTAPRMTSAGYYSYRLLVIS